MIAFSILVDFSNLSAIFFSSSATATFKAVLVSAIEILDATILNSNLLPVKAKGEVRLRSVESLKIIGRLWIPIFILPPVLEV